MFFASLLFSEAFIGYSIWSRQISMNQSLKYPAARLMISVDSIVSFKISFSILLGYMTDDN